MHLFNASIYECHKRETIVIYALSNVFTKKNRIEPPKTNRVPIFLLSKRFHLRCPHLFIFMAYIIPTTHFEYGH